MKQQTISDVEYSARKRKTKREEFLEIMDEIIPWEEWVAYIAPYYPSGKRGRPPKGIEKMLRMYLLQCWFNLSDEGVENAIYDSYAIEDYSAHDFRDTCATEWRESGISIDMIARLLGHQKTDVTEQRYVKYRPELYKQAQEKMSVYGTSDGTKRER